MERIKEKLQEVKDEVRMKIISLARQSCEVDMSGLQIRQSFAYYEEEAYHVEKLYIDPDKGTVRVQLFEYADSILLSEFSIEEQVGIYEALRKTFENSKLSYRIDYW